MASSLLASTQSSPLPSDLLLSSPYVIHFSTTWWLYTVSTSRSFFPPTFLVYYHVLQDLSFRVFVSLQDWFFLISEHRNSGQWWFCVLSSLCSRIFLSLWNTVSDAYEIQFYSTPSFPSYFCCAVLALKKLLTFKSDVLTPFPAISTRSPLLAYTGMISCNLSFSHAMNSLLDETPPLKVPFFLSALLSTSPTTINILCCS